MFFFCAVIIVPIVLLTANGLMAKSLDDHLSRLALGGQGPGLEGGSHYEEVSVSGALIAGSLLPTQADHFCFP